MRPQNKLLDLIRSNMQSPRRFDMKANGDAVDLYLYDVIDPYFGVSAEAFIKSLNGIDAPKINLHINSPGGDVFEARAIATAIRTHKSEIVSHIDGVAASAATYIAIAAKSVNIADGAFMMVHKAWTLAFGNSEDMRSVADLLDKIDGTIEADYIKKTGADAATVQQWMADETWFTAEESVAAKLADAIIASGENGATQNHWSLAAYNKAPKSLTEPPKAKVPEYDRALLDRRLTLLEKIAA